VRNVHVTLTAAGVAALNKTFSVSLFKAGLSIGTVNVRGRGTTMRTTSTDARR